LYQLLRQELALFHQILSYLVAALFSPFNGHSFFNGLSHFSGLLPF